MAIIISSSDPANSLSTIRVPAIPPSASSQGTISASREDTDKLDLAGQLRSRSLEQTARNNQEMARGAARVTISSIQREERSNQQEFPSLEFERSELRHNLQQAEASVQLLRGRTTFFKSQALRALATGFSINILV
jgi:hypothetical protein